MGLIQFTIMKILFTLCIVMLCLNCFGQSAKYIISESTKIKKESEPIAQVLEELKKGDTINLVGFDGGYWKVNHKNITGFINELFIDDNIDNHNLKIWFKGQKYPTFILAIGKTTSTQFRNKYGEPIEINRTRLSGYVSEQWVYRPQSGKTKLYYFTNDILTGIQD
jgi:hypothetical protein